MTDNVTPLPGSLAEEIIDVLELAIAEARAGKFIGVAFVAVVADGGVYTAACAGDAGRYALVGAIEFLKNEALTLPDT